MYSMAMGTASGYG